MNPILNLAPPTTRFVIRSSRSSCGANYYLSLRSSHVLNSQVVTRGTQRRLLLLSNRIQAQALSTAVRTISNSTKSFTVAHKISGQHQTKFKVNAPVAKMTPKDEASASGPASKAPPKVEYKQLGKSGLRVSVPILGAMSLGDKRWQEWCIEEVEALPLLKAAYDRGLNSWDTANVYSNGASEEIIGKAIKHYNIPRHKLVIMTKCCGTVREGNTPEILGLKDIDKTVDYINQRGLSRQGIFSAVEASLRRLDTPYIDLLQIHRFDKTVPVEETMKALHDLVESGKVRYIGASSMWAYQFATMQYAAEKHGWTKFVSMQNYYNLLYREEEREMIKLCNETSVGLIPWSPLSQGALARPAAQSGQTSRSKGKPAMAETDAEIVGRVEEIAKKHDWKMSQVALAWINKRIASPIIGFSSVERMDEAILAQGKILTEEEEKYLEELYKPKAVIGHQ